MRHHRAAYVIGIVAIIGCGGETEIETPDGATSSDGGIVMDANASNDEFADSFDTMNPCDCPPEKYVVTVEGTGISETLIVPDPAVSPSLCGEVLTGYVRNDCKYGPVFGTCSGENQTPPCVVSAGEMLLFVDPDGQAWEGPMTFILTQSPDGTLQGTYTADVALNGAMMTLSGTFLFCNSPPTTPPLC